MILGQLPFTNGEIEKVKEILYNTKKIVDQNGFAKDFINDIKNILKKVKVKDNIAFYDHQNRPGFKGQRDAYTNQELVSTLTGYISHDKNYDPGEAFAQDVVKCACEDILEEFKKEELFESFKTLTKSIDNDQNTIQEIYTLNHTDIGRGLITDFREYTIESSDKSEYSLGDLLLDIVYPNGSHGMSITNKSLSENSLKLVIDNITNDTIKDQLEEFYNSTSV